MKKLNLLLMGFMLLSVSTAFPQSKGRNASYKLEPDSLAIAYGKTTNIIFPFSIKSADRGSQDILVQKAKGLENILQLKAARKGFLDTNLTVVTADGKFYSFVIHYDEESPELNLTYSQSTPEKQEIYFSADIVNQQYVEQNSKLAFYDKNKVRGARQERYDIEFELNGIFVRDNIIYHRIKVTNFSKIDYDISQLRFFIRDSKKVKRTASQEIEIIPIYILNRVQEVEAEADNTFVFALPKFTIPEKKYLAIQLLEKDGGRHVELHVKNKKLMQITVLPKL